MRGGDGSGDGAAGVLGGRIRGARLLGRLSLAAILLTFGIADPAESATTRDERDASAARSAIRGWTVHIDNDLFAFADDDRDYTAGFSLTLGGDEADGNLLSASLDWIDARTRFGSFFDGGDAHSRSFEVGLLLFTPQDLRASEPLFDDRPYANLAYLSSSRLTHQPEAHAAWQSSLTLGVLGLPVAEHLHRSAHRAVGSQEPMGYAHQIADGGEPTFRYSISKYRLLKDGAYAGRPYHLRLGTTGSVGYLTEANLALDFRWGNLGVPWWSSHPTASDYAGHPPMRSPRESAKTGVRVQVAAGITLRARLYNSFLQGQFRSSDVTYSSSQLNHLLLDAWVGVTTVFRNDLSVSYTLRHQTEELKAGQGARDFMWASIGVAQQF